MSRLSRIPLLSASACCLCNTSFEGVESYSMRATCSGRTALHGAADGCSQPGSDAHGGQRNAALRQSGSGWKTAAAVRHWVEVVVEDGWLAVSSGSCHDQTEGMGYAGSLREDGRSRRLLAMSSYQVEANRLVGTAHIWRLCSFLLFPRPSPTFHHLHKPGFCIVAFPESGGSTVFYWWISFDF